MPISRDRLNSPPGGSSMPDIEPGTPGYDVLTYLATNSGQAFTQTEIHDATGVKYDRVGTILSQLKEFDLVRDRDVDWTIEGDDRIAAYNAMVSASSTSVTDDFYGEDA